MNSTKLNSSRQHFTTRPLKWLLSPPFHAGLDFINRSSSLILKFVESTELDILLPSAVSLSFGRSRNCRITGLVQLLRHRPGCVNFNTASEPHKRLHYVSFNTSASMMRPNLTYLLTTAQFIGFSYNRKLFSQLPCCLLPPRRAGIHIPPSVRLWRSIDARLRPSFSRYDFDFSKYVEAA